MQQQVTVLASFSDNLFLPLFCPYWAMAYFYNSSNIMQHP